MKLLTWNCNMAFRKKKEQALKLRPDILVIQECENPNLKGKWDEFSSYTWIGDNPNKGIGIFSRNGYNVKIKSDLRCDYSRYVVPVKIEGEKDYLLFSVWAMNDKADQKKRYIGQVYTAVKYYEELLDKNTIIAGDFNWNFIWDESPNSLLYGNLTETKNLLKEKKLSSVYHTLKQESFGKELLPTFYMHRKKKKPYHIDYIFMNDNKIGFLKNFYVGEFERWIEYSDHMPLFIEI